MRVNLLTKKLPPDTILYVSPFYYFHSCLHILYYISKSPHLYPGKRYFCQGWSLTKCVLQLIPELIKINHGREWLKHLRKVVWDLTLWYLKNPLTLYFLLLYSESLFHSGFLPLERASSWLVSILDIVSKTHSTVCTHLMCYFFYKMAFFAFFQCTCTYGTVKDTSKY